MTLGGNLFLLQTSFGTSVHSSTGFKLGTNLVTDLHCFLGFRSHVSSGTYKIKKKIIIEFAFFCPASGH